MWSRVATDVRSLEDVSGAVQDAWFAPEEMRHDERRQTLVVPFRQEGWPSGPPPDRQLVRESWRVREYRVAFFQGTLTVGHVHSVTEPEGWAQSGMLLGVSHDARAGEVRVCADDCLRVLVTAMEVRVVLTEEVAGWVTRRVGRWTRTEGER